MGGTGVIDHFLEVFTRYIDSGFGLLGGIARLFAAHAPRQVDLVHGDPGRQPFVLDTEGRGEGAEQQQEPQPARHRGQHTARNARQPDGHQG